jgi:hypothetical protein
MVIATKVFSAMAGKFSSNLGQLKPVKNLNEIKSLKMITIGHRAGLLVFFSIFIDRR